MTAAKPKRRYPVEPLTPREVARLLRQCSTTAPTGIRNRALITVMYRGGLRIDEALALRAANVNLDAGLIRVLHGKGDKARTVAIDDGGMAMVRRWIDARSDYLPPDGLLFCVLFPPPPGEPGGKLSDVYVRNMMHRIGRAAGIDKRVHPHGLRHSHAAELAAEGVPANVIQQQLGHEHLATTDTYLRHVAPAAVIAMGRSRPAWNPEEL